MSEAGLRVTSDIRGDLGGLPKGIDGAAYRIVQEALTNALKHARPSEVKVCVSRSGDLLRLEVRSDCGLVAHRRRRGQGRGQVRLILESQPDIEVVGEATDGQQALSLAWREGPQVLLMDVRMPRMNGIEATRAVVAEAPSTMVLVLTTFDIDEYVYEALRDGATGFLLKEGAPEQLIAAVRMAASGDVLLAPSRTRHVIEEHLRKNPEAARLVNGLTPREAEVLRLVARGLSNQDIANRLLVSEATVRTHVGHLLSKLELTSRVQAVVVAYESGLLTPATPEPQPADHPRVGATWRSDVPCATRLLSACQAIQAPAPRSSAEPTQDTTGVISRARGSPMARSTADQRAMPARQVETPVATAPMSATLLAAYSQALMLAGKSSSSWFKSEPTSWCPLR